MASRSSGRPGVGVYRWYFGFCAALTAASTMYAGVGKSGSPAPKPMTGRPAALRALALASTARVADSAIEPTRAETRGRAEVRVSGADVMTLILTDSASRPLRSGGAGP